MDDLHNGPTLVHRLAINIETWRKGVSEFLQWNIGYLKQYGVQELLLVVGNSTRLDNERDVVFVTPADVPMHTLNGMEKSDARGRGHFTVTWARMAKNVHECIEQFKEEQLEMKKRVEDRKYPLCNRYAFAHISPSGRQ
jgi:hypothetical protein